MLEQVADAVHAKGSYIFMQLWGLGRAARTPYLRERDPDFAYVSASDVPLPGRDEVPRPLTKDGACPVTARAFRVHSSSPSPPLCDARAAS